MEAAFAHQVPHRFDFEKRGALCNWSNTARQYHLATIFSFHDGSWRLRGSGGLDALSLMQSREMLQSGATKVRPHLRSNFNDSTTFRSSSSTRNCPLCRWAGADNNLGLYTLASFALLDKDPYGLALNVRMELIAVTRTQVTRVLRKGNTCT